MSPLPAIALAELAERAAGRHPDMTAHLARRDAQGTPGGPRWHLGSLNIPTVIRAANRDYRFVADVARLWEHDGLYGAELGSPGQYFWSVAMAMAVSLRDAREDDATADADALRRALRATWTRDSLIALPQPRRRILGVLGGVPGSFEGDPGKGNLGLTCANAGQRWNGAVQKMRWHQGAEGHGEILSLALDWRPRSRHKKAIAPQDIFHVLAGAERWDAPIAAEVIGLTDWEREVLRAVVRGDAAAARTAVAWLLPYGARRHQAWALTRTNEGVQCVFFGPGPHNTGAAHAATRFTSDGTWTTLRPGFSRNTKVSSGYAVEIVEGFSGPELREKRIVARVANGCGEEVSMPVLGGESLWNVWIKGSEITFNGERVA